MRKTVNRTDPRRQLALLALLIPAALGIALGLLALAAQTV